MPVLVVHGKDDALAPLAEAKKTAASCGEAGELVELDETGHLALVERPKAVARAIRDWWRRVGTHAADRATDTASAAAARPSDDELLSVPMSYCVPPPAGEQIGLQADKVADPGLPVFSFYRQHGRWPIEREPRVQVRHLCGGLYRAVGAGRA